MRIRLIAVALAVFGLGAIAVSQADEAWLNTGTVTRIDGTTFHMLDAGNNVFSIDAVRAEVFLGEATVAQSCCGFSVGDTVRVYGAAIGPGAVQGQRVRVLSGAALEAAEAGSAEEIRIVVRKSVPAGSGAGPEEPALPAAPPEWVGTALVTGIDYGRGQMTVRNSQGSYAIVALGAQIARDGRLVGLGVLNPGDAVRISGAIGGLNTIRAATVELLRAGSEANAVVTQYPVAASGVITSVDYPSFTITMQTTTLAVQVLVDSGTMIYSHRERMAFMDLKPGMEVKMSGDGSPMTGFAARQIQIVGTVP